MQKMDKTIYKICFLTSNLIICLVFFLTIVVDNLCADSWEEELFWDSPPIRVLVLSEVPGVKVEATMPFFVETNDGFTKKDHSIKIENLGFVEIKHLLNKIQIFNENLTEECEEVKLMPVSPFGVLSINGKRFRGNLVVYLRKGKGLNIVNIISLEQYLYGVVVSEMGHGPLEAQKAQAVAARTFAVAKMQKNKNNKYDLDATTASQVYGGKEKEDPQAYLAVDDTRGEVLGFEGKVIFDSLYHSTCGGYTANNEEVFFGTPLPYLRGVLDIGKDSSDILCQFSPGFQWRVLFSRSMLEESLRAFKIEGEVQQIKINKVGLSGRVKEIAVVSGEKEYVISGEKIRQFFKVPSTRFVLNYNSDGDLEIIGEGQGHGVGMCQWGAMELARRGEEYKTILAKYYQNSEILINYGKDKGVGKDSMLQ